MWFAESAQTLMMMILSGLQGSDTFSSSTNTMKTLAAILLTAIVTILQTTAVIGDDIINGRKASKNSLQYMASVQVHKEHHCGGFLISPKHVLTAAHCDTSERMTVILGEHNINPQKNLERYEVVRKFIPKPFKDVQKGDDIMLLKLGREAVLGGKVRSINITDKHHRVKNGKCLVAGWGLTKERTKSNELLAVNILTVDINECRKAWKKYNEKKMLPPNIICAGGYKQNAGVCWGDSGGPLVCDSAAVGIVSFIKKCKYPDVPNIYTDISKYSRWIKQIMNTRET